MVLLNSRVYKWSIHMENVIIYLFQFTKQKSSCCQKRIHVVDE